VQTGSLAATVVLSLRSGFRYSGVTSLDPLIPSDPASVPACNAGLTSATLPLVRRPENNHNPGAGNSESFPRVRHLRTEWPWQCLQESVVPPANKRLLAKYPLDWRFFCALAPLRRARSSARVRRKEACRHRDGLRSFPYLHYRLEIELRLGLEYCFSSYDPAPASAH
jgi:hypothetical protein